MSGRMIRSLCKLKQTHRIGQHALLNLFFLMALRTTDAAGIAHNFDNKSVETIKEAMIPMCFLTKYINISNKLQFSGVPLEANQCHCNSSFVLPAEFHIQWRIHQLRSHIYYSFQFHSQNTARLYSVCVPSFHFISKTSFSNNPIENVLTFRVYLCRTGRCWWQQS